MTELIVSFPIYKPDRQGSEKFKATIRKILSKMRRREGKPEIEEHNQFLMGSINLDEEYYQELTVRKNIERKLFEQYDKYKRRMLKTIQRRYKKDPELDSTINAFTDVSRLSYVNITDELNALKSLSQLVEEDIGKIYSNGILTIWFSNSGSGSTILSGDSNIELTEKEQTLNLLDLSDELTLASFGMYHAPIICKQIKQIQQKFPDFLKKIIGFTDQIKFANSEEERQYLGEVGSIILGKILGIREPLGSARKQLERYMALEEEMRVEPESHEESTIYRKFLNLHEVKSTIEMIEEIERAISENYEILRINLSHYYDLKIGSSDTNLVGSFVSFVAKMYHTLDHFRLVTENFEDITNFTTISGKLGSVDELSNDEKEEMKEHIIYGKGIFKSFPLLYSTVYALRGVDIKIKPGEFVAIMGPSGSGKTTLLNILSGLDKADRGVISVAGIDLNRAGERKLIKMRREVFSFVYQTYNLLPVLTNEENVRLPADYSGKRSNKKERARKLLAKVGLERYIRSRPNLLSGGEQQRVTIARAFMNQPKIIFCDEPTGDLDHKTGSQIMDLIEEFNKEGTAIVLVTHDIEVAKRADRIIKMRDGKIIQEGRM